MDLFLSRSETLTWTQSRPRRFRLENQQSTSGPPGAIAKLYRRKLSGLRIVRSARLGFRSYVDLRRDRRRNTNQGSTANSIEHYDDSRALSLPPPPRP